jgi:beta-lactamase regulating signal transducer with metallopeptidase domain
MNVDSPLQVFELPFIKSPVLCGFIRPRLLLPEGMLDRFSPQEFRFIFLHELAHVKRRDIIVAWLTTLLQTLHWFNPLIWYGFRQMRADRELACDVLALEQLSDSEAADYGDTILKLLKNCSHRAPLLGALGILEETTQTERRIRMIANYEKRKKLPAVAIAVAVAASILYASLYLIVSFIFCFSL